MDNKEPISPSTPPAPPSPEAIKHERKMLKITILVALGLLIFLPLTTLGVSMLKASRAGNTTVVPSTQPTKNIPTPTTNPTQGWTQYLNEKNQYSFMYPSDITVETNVATPGTTKLLFLRSAVGSPTYITIQSDKVTGVVDLKTLPSGFTVADYPSQTITIGGQKAFYIPNTPGEGPGGSEAYVQNGDMLYSIQLVNGASDMADAANKTMRQMLATIVFTTPSPTISQAAPSGSQTMCTMEAKLCPDGKTYVGRQGPSCAFATCPQLWKKP